VLVTNACQNLITSDQDNTKFYALKNMSNRVDNEWKCAAAIRHAPKEAIAHKMKQKQNYQSELNKNRCFEFHSLKSSLKHFQATINIFFQNSCEKKMH